MLRAAQTTWKTDTGRQRRDNEDSAFARSPVFVVAQTRRGRVIHPGRVLRPRAIGLDDAPSAPAQIAQRTPRDPHQKQVEHDQKAVLQTDGNGLQQEALLQLELDPGSAELDLVARL